MMRSRALLRDRRGSAAAEMALVAPPLCAIMLGSIELGSFFYDEHILQKAVRDGARYAARQNFSFYVVGGACAAPTDATLIQNVRNLVRGGLLASGSDRFADIQNADITITAACNNGANYQGGIYRNNNVGAPVVTVRAVVDYAPVIGAFGFTGAGLKLNATERAAVMGI